MLPKIKRVEKMLFPKVFSGGRVIHSPYITLRFILSPKSAGKFSFVVSKAVAKKAADRNLLRRRGYAAVSNIKNIIGGTANVFFFKKGADKLPYREIEEEIKSLLGKAGLIQK